MLQGTYQRAGVRVDESLLQNLSEEWRCALERIEAAGGRLLEQTRIANPDFKSKVICVLDPDGVRIELVEIEAELDPFAPLGTPIKA